KTIATVRVFPCATDFPKYIAKGKAPMASRKLITLDEMVFEKFTSNTPNRASCRPQVESRGGSGIQEIGQATM
ncbi:MAG: hypothetical protein WCO94_04915, partial [Verrucomicrobiota bacterium]